MHPSRGDSKPCTVGVCDGTMQFGRRLENDSRPDAAAAKPPAASFDDATGWICSREPGHFSEVAPRNVA